MSAPTDESVNRVLRDPEAVAALGRLRELGYTPAQVGAAMESVLAYHRAARRANGAQIGAAELGLEPDEIARGCAAIDV